MEEYKAFKRQYPDFSLDNLPFRLVKEPDIGLVTHDQPLLLVNTGHPIVDQWVRRGKGFEKKGWLFVNRDDFMEDVVKMQAYFGSRLAQEGYTRVGAEEIVRRDLGIVAADVLCRERVPKK